MLEQGVKVDVLPIPPIPENTVTFNAGPISFAVEYRVVDNELANATYGAEGMQHLRDTPEYGVGAVLEDSGVSIHVYGDDQREYLRFDCFLDDPHYHYMRQDEGYHQVLPLDIIANGDPLEWTLRCLRTQLAPMLRATSGAAYADKIDLARLKDVLNQVEQKAKAATRK